MTLRTPVNPRVLLTWLGLGFGATGLVMQFFLSMQVSFTNGRDFPGFLGHFFAFYTILTNTVLVLIYLSEVLPTPRLELLRSPITRGLMAANIALVGLYVYFVLRHYGALEGVDLLADNILHYLCPTLYLLWWLVSQRHGQLRWNQLPIMLAPTLVYFLYILARGVWVQQYPYPVLNVVELGYGQVLLNALFMAAALALLCIAVVTTDKLIARQTRTNPAWPFPTTSSLPPSSSPITASSPMSTTRLSP